MTAWHFSRERNHPGLSTFVAEALAIILTALPFMAGRSGYTLGIGAGSFAVLSELAYLLFHATLGVLVGSAFAAIMRTATAS